MTKGYRKISETSVYGECMENGKKILLFKHRDIDP